MLHRGANPYLLEWTSFRKEIGVQVSKTGNLKGCHPCQNIMKIRLFKYITDYLVDLVPPRVGNETPYSLRNADNYQQVHANFRLSFDSFLPSTIREWNNLPADVKSAQTLTSFKYKFVPPRVGNETPYSLRNADNYQQVHANFRLYFDSFLPSTIREWNNLPADVKSAQTLTSFKYKFKRNTPKIPKYYFFGDRGNQILHTRLRTECSTLQFHLYRSNLIPEPYCTCGAVENTSHFLFKCPKFNAFRRELLLTVSNYVEPSEAVLLFGDDTLSGEGNEVIFRAVHKYIQQTKRFSSNK